MPDKSNFFKGMVAGGALVLLGMILGAAGDSQGSVEFETVTAKRILLTDAKGDPRISMFTTRHGGSIIIEGENDEPVTSLGGTPVGGAVIVYSTDGRPYSILSAEEHGGRMQLFNKIGRPSADLP